MEYIRYYIQNEKYAQIYLPKYRAYYFNVPFVGPIKVEVIIDSIPVMKKHNPISVEPCGGGLYSHLFISPQMRVVITRNVGLKQVREGITGCKCIVCGRTLLIPIKFRNPVIVPRRNRIKYAMVIHNFVDPKAPINLIIARTHNPLIIRPSFSDVDIICIE